jgi:hypothetical protein
MNILFISFSEIPLSGGAGRSYAMVRALAEAGHTIDLLTPKSTAPCSGSIRVLGGAGYKGLSRASFRLLIGWTVFFGKYDAVHAVDGAAFFVVKMRRWVKTRLVYDAQSRVRDGEGVLPLLMRISPAFMRSLERGLLRKASLVFSTCEVLSRDLKALCAGVPLVQVEDVPVQFISPRQEDEEYDLFAWFERRPTYLVTGCFHETMEGGNRTLMLAVRKVLDVVPDAAFVIKCADTLSLEEIARSLDIAARCIFITEQAPGVFQKALRAADATLFVPLRGGRYIHEDVYSLMNAGVPLVTLREQAYRALLGDHNSIPAIFSSESLTESILRAIQEPLLAYPLAVEAQKMIADHYGFSSFKYRLRKAYTTLK